MTIAAGRRRGPAGAEGFAMASLDRAEFRRSMTGDEPYGLGPDSLPRPGVPRGETRRFRHVGERIYPGVERDCWLHVPAGLDPNTPSPIVVFQDGGLYLGRDVEAPTVFDNLIHAGDLPPMLALFANPGEAGPGNPIFGGADNRSWEYDSLGDAYARFLLEELLPVVARDFRLSDNPADRALVGFSSGGICAFTAAWERPGAFGKVASHCGSFADIRGGHHYPPMIRKAERKPIRVFLQSGANDLNVVFGNWPLANQEMASALAYRGYDFRFEFGVGGHTLKHADALLPETLRWLWRDSPGRS